MTTITTQPSTDSSLPPREDFLFRHLGPDRADLDAMLATLGCRDLHELVGQTVPPAIALKKRPNLAGPRDEFDVTCELRRLGAMNKPVRSLIGMGYHGCVTPAVILRNILENPGWYTQYTPYQAEISQGRLEALLNFQTLVIDLTGLPAANASMLDEATAAAEAMAMCHAIAGDEETVFFAARDCHPQTLAVVATRARAMRINLLVGDVSKIDFKTQKLCGVLVQYPATDGRVEDYSSLINAAHSAGTLVAMVTDLLALTLLKAPGELGEKGADIAVGSTQRLGMPMGLGGPHAAFMATKQQYLRKMPGRIIGVSKDAQGNPAYRLAIQTREQHIRREKATSNICTAQVLPAVVASMFAVHHGPAGLKAIAKRIHEATTMLACALAERGHDIGDKPFFDTLCVKPVGISAGEVMKKALASGINLRDMGDGRVGVTLDERTDETEIKKVAAAFSGSSSPSSTIRHPSSIPPQLRRTSAYLAHRVFNAYHAEHELLRYIKRLESRDLSLTTSMIPLGSCTMKLNPAVSMLPISWPELGDPHPYAPADQHAGYAELFRQLENQLGEITGLPAVSLQPNAGSQGEYTGLLVIRAYHESRGDLGRKICLIPVSAHGTNPASAVTAGFEVVAVACDDSGNVNADDLRKKAEQHAKNLGALMITYPSTHGVFEEGVRELCQIIHRHGGQVYMDGANMNAQVGLTSPASIGADVCHLNLHKTFCSPHGGGGPGMGPICAAEHLRPFLPAVSIPDLRKQTSDSAGGVTSAQLEIRKRNSETPLMVSAAPYGSALILAIPWVYIALMGDRGLQTATSVAILNANYMAKRLSEHYPILYTGKNGRVAHEFILDCRAFEHEAGIRVDDMSKRLMDYGFHAPTMSWPVPGTLMIEPTESESKAEMDRLCDALIAIRREIRDIVEGKSDRTDNPLKNAPHTAASVTADTWSHAYTRQQAAYPAPWLKAHKFWPSVARIDNAYGDRNLICTCPPMPQA